MKKWNHEGTRLSQSQETPSQKKKEEGGGPCGKVSKKTNKRNGQASKLTEQKKFNRSASDRKNHVKGSGGYKKKEKTGCQIATTAGEKDQRAGATWRGEIRKRQRPPQNHFQMPKD